MRRGRGIVVGSFAPIFALASISLFAPGIFAGKIPVFRDLLVLMIPLRFFARDAVRSGTLPLWTDDLFFGAPFLANYQSAVLYPPSAILYGLPFATGFSAFLAFHVLIAGWGTARYLENHVARGPALLGGLVFSIGGFFASLISLTNQLAVASWMPWALAEAEGLAKTGSCRSFLRLTLIFALQALGGAPEALLLTIAIIAASLSRGLLRGRDPWRPWRAICASLVLAAALSAAQLAPTAEYALQTDRTEGLPYETVVAESIAPRSLMQLVVPHTFEAGAPGFVPEGGIPLFWSLYVGVIPLALAMAAVSLRPVGFWPLVFGAGLLLSFGGHTPLFSALYHLAPWAVGVFRFPGKFFLLCHFALAVSSAEGLDETLRGDRARRVATVWMAALGATGAGIGAIAALAPRSLLDAFGYSLPPDLARSAEAVLAGRLGLVALRGALLSWSAATVVWLFGRGRITERALVFAIGALTALDLFSVHAPSLVFTDWRSLRRSGAEEAERADRGERLFHYCTSSPRCLPEGAPGLGPWGGFLRPGESAERQARALWAALIPDAPMVYGLGAVAGSDGFSTRSQREFFRTLALLPRERAVHLLASLGVSRLIGNEPLGGLPEVVDARQKGNGLPSRYSLAGRAPRTYLAERVLAAPDTASALERLADPDFRPGRDAVVTASDGGPVAGVSGGEIVRTAFAPTEIRADVLLPAEGLWVVTGTWFPGWEAAVDGSPAEVEVANGIQRGVRVPAGHHRVEMRYRPSSFRWGLAVSAAGLIALAVAVRRALAERER